VVLIFISLVVSDIKYLSWAYLLSVYSLEKSLLISFSYLLIKLFAFILFSIKISLHILEINCGKVVCNIFFWSVIASYPCNKVFQGTKVFISVKSKLFFLFCRLYFKVSPDFSFSKRCIVLSIIIKFLVHFKLILMWHLNISYF
jgi:hypothetical protein